MALLAALWAITFAPPSRSATRLDETRARLDSLAREQGAQRERLGRLQGQEQAGLSRLGQLEERGEARRRLRRQLEAELRLLEVSKGLQEEELAGLRVQQDSLVRRRGATSVDRERVRAEAALLARRLFPLRHLDPLARLFNANSLSSTARSLRQLPWLGRGLERRLVQLARLDKEMAGLQAAGDEAAARGARHLADLERDGRRREAARQEAQRELQRLDQEQAEQGRLLRSVRQDKDLAAAQAERLRGAGETVARQMENLQRGWREREARKESETLRQKAVQDRLQAGAAPAGAAPPAPRPAADGRVKSSAPAPPPAGKAPASSGAALRKGQLPAPVVGRVSRAFGARTDPALGVVLDNPGVDYACAPGAAVKAVQAGRVEKLTWVPGFGNTLLLSHGGESWTVYAKLDEVQVKEGQAVSAGQQLGKAGRFDSTDQGSLHFEIWQGRSPQDPQSWLAR